MSAHCASQPTRQRDEPSERVGPAQRGDQDLLRTQAQAHRATLALDAHDAPEHLRPRDDSVGRAGVVASHQPATADAADHAVDHQQRASAELDGEHLAQSRPDGPDRRDRHHVAVLDEGCHAPAAHRRAQRGAAFSHASQ